MKRSNVFKKIWVTVITALVATMTGIQAFAISTEATATESSPYMDWFITLCLVVFGGIAVICVSIYFSEKKDKKRKAELRAQYKREEEEAKAKRENEK